MHNSLKSVPLQCVFHSIRFKVNKKIGCPGVGMSFLPYSS
nr:MAG TPA: Leukemia inhibitory factor receptor D2 domain [Caudoviricetes sp.]